MMNPSDWEQGNERYLAASLAWLRLRLERAASRGGVLAQPSSAPTPTEPESFRRRLLRRQKESPVRAPSMPLLPPANISEEQIAEADAARSTLEAELEPPPRLVFLSRRLGLSSFERNVLLLCAARELDMRINALCDQAQRGAGRDYPTFALAMTLFDDPSWDVLSPERPLRYWRLIEINQPSGCPLTISQLSADEWIVNYIKGLNYLDDRLVPLLAPLEVTIGAAELPPSQQEQVHAIVRAIQQVAPIERLPVVQLLGTDALSKRLIAWHAAGALQLNLYRLPAKMLSMHTGELETLARLWQRQSLLLPISLYLDAHESEGAQPAEGQEALVSRLNRFLIRSDGIFFLDTRDVWPDLDRASLTLDIRKPTPAEQQAAWAVALEDQAGDNPARLAGQFNLSLAEIQQITESARRQTAENARPFSDNLWEACLKGTRPRLETLAQRLDPKATWDEIVLAEQETALLHQIAEQVGQRSTVYDEWGFRRKMNRGLGINALFAGQSGTGKTMAAEVIANELRLNLYRIDLSAVVSKYIGETEKNLRRLFDAAEDGGAILFFDEADAIFGKRSEVKDSHDRYANIEINYLLQRMEAYRGLAILATNMKSALDPAFMRRLRFIVNFPVPGLTERRLIWEKVFPVEVPRAELDFERLARFNLTGGNIHSIALNAAFLAAQAAEPVTMPILLRAVRTELRKFERQINEADFRWQATAGAQVA